MLQRRGMMLMVKVVSMVSASAQMGRLAYILAQGGFAAPARITEGRERMV